MDEPDYELDAIWIEEVEKRLKAYRAGKLKGIPMEEIFKELKAFISDTVRDSIQDLVEDMLALSNEDYLDSIE